MGKSLVAVNAGPRVKWNTDTLINEAIKGAESQGATVQKQDRLAVDDVQSGSKAEEAR